MLRPRLLHSDNATACARPGRLPGLSTSCTHTCESKSSALPRVEVSEPELGTVPVFEQLQCPQHSGDSSVSYAMLSGTV